MYSRRIFAIVVLGSWVLGFSAGCDLDRSSKSSRAPRIVPPPGVVETIAEYADLVGGDAMSVRGYGVVVGLGDAGSSEVPSHLRQSIIQQMLKHYVGSATVGTGAVKPDRILSDKDTAVVLVNGRIPPAAPLGTRFDIYVEALPQTQTLSLDGGLLMSTELHLSLGVAAEDRADVKTWATGRGAVFVNPFIERTMQRDQVALRRGRIPNGGVVTRPRPIRLELRRPDYRMARLIQRRINARFPGKKKVAVAKTPSMIELRIPASHRQDYVHFLELLTHLYVESGQSGQQDRYARKLTQSILLPDARQEDIALAWEAMGRQVMPVIRDLYASSNSAAAFYSARAGLRLGDSLAMDAMIRIARHANSPFQIPAVREIGRARKFIEGLATLRTMLSNSNELLRVAAYEALKEYGYSASISRRDVGGRFVIDVVDTDGDYVIYATVTGEPKIVLFGRDIPINRPLFYCPGDELVTINASNTDKKIMVYRRIPGAGINSAPFYVKPRVDTFIRTLGLRPSIGLDGRIEGLGLTYSQVVGVLYGLCKSGYVPAKFVLQPAPELRRIYSSVPAAGRPDMPE